MRHLLYHTSGTNFRTTDAEQVAQALQVLRWHRSRPRNGRELCRMWHDGETISIGLQGQVIACGKQAEIVLHLLARRRGGQGWHV
jgi:hypothetical protein